MERAGNARRAANVPSEASGKAVATGKLAAESARRWRSKKVWNLFGRAEFFLGARSKPPSPRAPIGSAGESRGAFFCANRWPPCNHPVTLPQARRNGVAHGFGQQGGYNDKALNSRG